MIDTISLDAHWRISYRDHALERRTDGLSIASLAKFDTRQIESALAWLEREFDLPMPDECISYRLEIAGVPVGTHLRLNGRELGELTEPLALDVTDMVALEDNRIAFRVTHNAAGSFGAVQLIAIPCAS